MKKKNIAKNISHKDETGGLGSAPLCFFSARRRALSETRVSFPAGSSSARLDETHEQRLNVSPRVRTGPCPGPTRGKVVLNYAEGGSATLSGRGTALRRAPRMDVALPRAPRSALSGLMTARCSRIHVDTQ